MAFIGMSVALVCLSVWNPHHTEFAYKPAIIKYGTTTSLDIPTHDVVYAYGTIGVLHVVERVTAQTFISLWDIGIQSNVAPTMQRAIILSLKSVIIM